MTYTFLNPFHSTFGRSMTYRVPPILPVIETGRLMSACESTWPWLCHGPPSVGAEYAHTPPSLRPSSFFADSP